MNDRIEYCIELIGDVETKFLKFSKKKYFKDLRRILYYSIAFEGQNRQIRLLNFSLKGKLELSNIVEAAKREDTCIMSSKRSIYEIRFILQMQEYLIIFDLQTLVQ